MAHSAQPPLPYPTGRSRRCEPYSNATGNGGTSADAAPDLWSVTCAADSHAAGLRHFHGIRLERMTATEEKTATANAPNGATLSGEQRVAMLSRKLERFRESHDKRDRAAREWMAEIEREIEELKSSLTD